jgi:hypothetical protein
MFALRSEHLQELCALNFFPVSNDRMVFLGFRGASPVNPERLDFAEAQELLISDIDHVHPRCTLVQWLPSSGELAVFAGSTTPHRRYVKKALEKEGRGANQLMTGFYADYRKGEHGIGKDTGHSAFRQTNAHPIRRTADDFDFDGDDRVEFDNPFDNIHAAWSMGVDHDSYASAGCQVVVGYPQCRKRENKPDTGAWRAFKGNAYSIEQNSFEYALFNGRDALRMVTNGPLGMVRLRYGSEGSLVRSVQESLKQKNFYEGAIDDQFGPRMLRAVVAFQESEFGPAADDGIVGPTTASALGVDWPARLDRA